MSSSPMASFWGPREKPAGGRRDPRRDDRGGGPGAGREARDGTEIIDATGALCHPGRGRRARPSRAAVLRHGLQRRLEHRHPRGGSRRRDHRDRLRHPLRPGDPARRVQQLDGPGQAQGVRRLLLPHGHHQLGPPRPRDGEDGRDGLPDLQGIHDLCIRGLAGRRPGDLQHARAVPRPGGDAAGPRRIEPRARRADRAASHARADAPATGPRLHADDPAQLHRGRGDPARDHLGRGDRRPALHRPHVDRARGRPRQGRPGARGRRLRRDLCAVPRARRLGLRRTRRPSLRLLPAGQEEEGPGAALEGAARRRGLGHLDRHVHVHPGAESALGGRLDQDPDGAARPGDAAADRLHPRRARRPADHGGVRRQVLHQPGQAHGPLSAARASSPRAATPTSRSSTPRSGSRSITRRWRRTPTGARTRAGRWRASPRRRSAAAGRSSTDYKFVGESGWGRWLPRERAGLARDDARAAAAAVSR